MVNSVETNRNTVANASDERFHPSGRRIPKGGDALWKLVKGTDPSRNGVIRVGDRRHELEDMLILVVVDLREKFLY